MFMVLFTVLYPHAVESNLPDFRLFDQSLERSGEKFATDNLNLYNDINKDTLHVVREELFDEIKLLRVSTDKFLAYLKKWQYILARGNVNGQNVPLSFDFSALDEIYLHYPILTGTMADSIQHSIDSYYDALMSLTAPQYRRIMELMMPIAKYRSSEDWFGRPPHKLREFARFTSSADLYLILSSLRNDALLSEWMVMWNMYLGSSSFGCGFQALQCIAIPSKEFTKEGEKIKAILMLAAYNPKVNPIIETAEGNIVKKEYGVATWQKQESDVLGLRTVQGTAVMYERDSVKVGYPWSFQYLVVAKGTSIQVDRANVLYTGIPSRVVISVPGYGADNLTLRVNGAIVEKLSSGEYMVTPKKLRRELFALVDAENSKKEISTVACRRLVVKEVPPPVVYIANAEDGMLSVDRFAGVKAKSSDEDIDIDYDVLSYELTLIHDKQVIGSLEATGKGIPAKRDIEELLKKSVVGDKLIVDNIRVEGSNEIEYYPASISYTIN